MAAAVPMGAGPQHRQLPGSPPSSAAEEPGNGEQQRGRKPKRDSSDGEGGGSGDDDKEGGKGTRKRKRSRKGLDKKYQCPHPDCGKSYSRAEHLYRHQLNHTPKQIYKCDFPDCPRWFVRQDLCARHRERHTTRGSHLQRRDSQAPGFDQPQGAPPPVQVTGGSDAQSGSGRGSGQIRASELSVNTQQAYSQQRQHQQSGYDAQLQSPMDNSIGVAGGRGGPASAPYSADTFRSSGGYGGSGASGGDYYQNSGSLQRSNSDGHHYYDPNLMGQGQDQSAGTRSTSMSSYDQNRPQGFVGYDQNRYSQTIQGSGQHAIASPVDQDQTQFRRPTTTMQQQQQHRQANGYNYVSSSQFPPMTSLPPPVYSAATHTSNSTATTQPQPQPQQQQQQQQQRYYGTNNNYMSNIGQDEFASLLAGDPSLGDTALSMFELDGYTKSPTLMTDNFTAWLFNDAVTDGSGGHSGHRRTDSGTMLDPNLRVPFTGPGSGLTTGGIPATPSQDPMAVASLLGSTMPRSIISDKKRQALLDLIRLRFNETAHSAVENVKDAIFSGDIDAEHHALSLRSMQTYIGSYWYHFHDQMPILHRPTFSADNAQNLLLIAVIAIGAANLDKMHGSEMTSQGAELANFLAWHIRGELFMDKDFPPPTKLWVLQALLLLEAYEKLYSSRVLHERSQIHHATTISLLRRGSALLGRSAMDSPPNGEDASSGATAGLVAATSAASIADTPDAWWNRWITREATKRVAFAAFIMDSIHATMFSHTAVMVAHEMRLRLPCDDALWTATSGVEVNRLREEHGGEPISFLEGLKATLNGRPLKTNIFGRTALMAGLLNVSFHLGQRDMQVRSLGVAVGGKDMWRGTLTKAFDIWERDWDTGGTDLGGTGNNATSPGATGGNGIGGLNNGPLARTKAVSPVASWPGSTSKDEDQVFESRVVLHHLAHMGMHVDIVQCQIFAGAPRLLGRTITEADRTGADRRMREVWAPKASARDAVFYSLRFLALVLRPYLEPQRLPGSAGSEASAPPYSPRDDYLLNRPWVLYFAALVVWSYGFALDGQLPRSAVPDALLHDRERQVEDMRAFMARVGAVAKPDDLERLEGRNRVVGLLGVLVSSFRDCRWELMREAGRRLNECVKKLTGRNAADGSTTKGV